MKPFIARQWTKEEQREMAQASTDAFLLLKKQLKDKPMMMAQTAKSLYQTVNEEFGFTEIVNITKNRMVDRMKEMNRILEIVKGMAQCNINLILFRNDPEVWMQYYMSVYLKKVMVVACREEDRPFVEIMKTEPLVTEILYTDKFDDEFFKKLVKRVEDAGAKI
jgi:hypothetical protein